MSKELTHNLVKSILIGNKEDTDAAFKAVMTARNDSVIESKKAAVASQIYGKAK